jgi:hypothetical protein
MSAVRTLPNVVKDALDKSPGRFPLASVAIGRRRVALSNHWRADSIVLFRRLSVR